MYTKESHPSVTLFIFIFASNIKFFKFNASNFLHPLKAEFIEVNLGVEKYDRG